MDCQQIGLETCHLDYGDRELRKQLWQRSDADGLPAAGGSHDATQWTEKKKDRFCSSARRFEKQMGTYQTQMK